MLNEILHSFAVSTVKPCCKWCTWNNHVWTKNL